ncbi:MAG: dTMP kinase [Legionella sp.]|nr:dTMP kinase [Legionella sp.]
MASGKLIVIEGLEGAGKSTAINTVMDFLARKNISAITTREPGGTAIGEQIRNIIKNPDYKETLDDKSELLLLYTARIQLIEQIIKPALKQGIWVVADRFELSTLAYQGGGRQLDMVRIKQLSDFCLNGFKPDLTLYLDLSPELGMQRVQLRGTFDRIEQQDSDFFQRTHEMYLQQIKNNNDIRIIDASCALDKVQSVISAVLNEFVHERIE